MSETLLRWFRSTGSDYENGLFSTFKTLSYFAALWDLDPSSEECTTALSNIEAVYVCDAITSAWSSRGDQRLVGCCSSSRDYGTRISEEQFDQAFDQWVADQTSEMNFGKDIKCLITIHISLGYPSASVSNGETFELEHIIARKRIGATDSSRPRHILGNSLGNCIYLPRGINNPKKDKTLCEINDHNRYSQLMKESQCFSEDEMQKAIQTLAASDYESVNGLLRERSRQVTHTLVHALLENSVWL